MVVRIEDEHVLVCHLSERILWVDNRSNKPCMLR